MFKYLWIVIIALIVFGFIWYTVDCIIEAYHFTHKDWPSALSRFSDEHDWLSGIWVAIIFFGIIALFVASLSAYLKTLE